MPEITHDNPPPPLSQLWQLPVLLLSVLLFGVGLYMAVPRDHAQQYTQVLDDVRSLVTAGRYEQALTALDERSEGFTQRDDATRSRFHLLVGDAVYLGQKSEGWSRPTDHRRIIQAYTTSEQLGWELDDQHIERIADSYVALGETEAALTRLNDLGEAGAGARQELLREIIETAMHRIPLDAQEAERRIERLLAEPKLMRAHEVWAVARRAELAMHRGEARQVVGTLLRWIARLQDDQNVPLGDLMLQLGRAYLADGDEKNAERWLLRSQQVLDDADPLHGEVLVGLGHVRFGEGNIIEALEFFSSVVERYAQTEAYPDALLGKAEAEARLGATKQALADYDAAVKLAREDAPVQPSWLARLIGSLENQHDLRFGRGEYGLAVKFLDLEQRLFDPPAPPRLHLKRAITHEQIARKHLGLEEGEPAQAIEWSELDPEARRKVAEHYAASADAYLSHAHAVTLEAPEAYRQSLWRAGDCYDKAGLHKQAIMVYSEFVEDQTEDPRVLSATHRLAQAHQADGQFDRAIELYTRLIEEHPKSPEAYASLVPLAHCYLAQGSAFTDRAEQVLRSVVTDHPALRPESTEYQQALIELGQLYYRRGGEGDYEKAIARLDEAVERYPEEGERPGLMFQLGDAYRKSARQIERELAGSLPPSKRAEFEAERARRLERAGQNFQAVIEAYKQHDSEELDDLHRLYLRNSYFYLADCAYDLGRFDGSDGAIALYEKARQAYDKDPAALIALVQIVNSYAELGRWEDARRANERARAYLDRIPEEAFEDPTLPMDRQHWQRWLDWTGQLALTQQPAADAGTP